MSKKIFNNTILFKKKMSIREQARFARRLGTLLGAGIPISEAFLFIAKSSLKKRHLHDIYLQIVGCLSSGLQCSYAFAQVGIFDQSLIHLVRIGEESGSLQEALVQAASMLERRDDLSKKITGVMIYPAFIGLATLAIAGFLVMYIFPKIIPLITSMNIPLPLLTKLLIIVSGTLIKHWLIIIGCSVIAMLLFIFLIKSSAFLREKIRQIMFHVPIIGVMFKGRIIIEIFNSLGLLLEYGEMLPIALISVRDGTAYSEFKRLFDHSLLHINKGGKLSEAISGKLFPSLVIDLVETGERTGGIAAACTNIARIYEAEADEMIQKISGIIEPVLMLGMGGVVGSIALSIVMPIYEITNHLSH